MPTLIDRIRLARAGSAVERCHTVPHSQRYSVGHHSLDLITLIVLTWQAAHDGALPRAELLVAAAFHDVPEVVVGDVPKPTKDLLNGSLDRVEEKVLDYLGVGVTLEEEEQRWLDVCDRLELSLWAIEETSQRGHLAFRSWVHPSSITHWPHEVLFTLVHQALMNNNPIGWEELKEASGL